MPVILQISSGQGPAECRKFVPLLAEIICREAEQSNLRCNLLSDVPGKDRENGTLKLRLVVTGSLANRYGRPVEYGLWKR